MTDVYFVHIYGTSLAADALLAAVEPVLKKSRLAVLHVPVALPGADPLPVDQDERLLLLQLAGSEMAGEVDSVARRIMGVSEVTHQAMACERITPGGPDDPHSRPTAVSWWVQYNGPAKDPAAFHAYYRAHHLPIVHRMPGIRSLNLYLPQPWTPPAGVQSVDHLQLVQAMFDHLDGLLAMRASRQRKQGLKDFENYPSFEGPVTHQAMNSRRITP